MGNHLWRPLSCNLQNNGTHWKFKKCFEFICGLQSRNILQCLLVYVIVHKIGFLRWVFSSLWKTRETSELCEFWAVTCALVLWLMSEYSRLCLNVYFSSRAKPNAWYRHRALNPKISCRNVTNLKISHQSRDIFGAFPINMNRRKSQLNLLTQGKTF